MPGVKLFSILFFCAIRCAFPAAAATLRLGIIGTDTSHATAFTKILNDESSPDHVPGGQVVAAYKGGSPDIESSATRVDKFADELRTKWKVQFYSSIPELCRKVDAVLLESVDGRVHLEQVRAVIAAHKPVFIDKPMASTLQDVREIARLATEAGVPWFSASSLRYGEIAQTMKFADATGVETWGPGPLEPHHQLELSWYAIHAIELLYSLMGQGCEEVTRTFTPDADVIVGRWKDGRLGSVRALRPYSEYGAVVFRPKQIMESPSHPADSYGPLLVEVMKFFETGQPPVPNRETLEIFAFMDAAQRSKDDGGKPAKLR
jgi:predicted dehydrogenase